MVSAPDLVTICYSHRAGGFSQLIFMLSGRAVRAFESLAAVARAFTLRRCARIGLDTRAVTYGPFMGDWIHEVGHRNWR